MISQFDIRMATCSLRKIVESDCLPLQNKTSQLEKQQRFQVEAEKLLKEKLAQLVAFEKSTKQMLWEGYTCENEKKIKQFDNKKK